MKVKVAINGFGRIGRYLTRLCLTDERIQLVQINDLAPIETLSHLLKYDSIHGKLAYSPKIEGNKLLIGSQKIVFSQFPSPKEIEWLDETPDIIVEATGLFLTRKLTQIYLDKGAKRVILSAPPQSEDVPTIVLGVNDELILGETILSNASCTTNSAAPLIAIMKQLCRIESAYITTVHSYTTDQRLHDSPHKDLRRARAAAQSIVPTTTGAAKALTKIFPELHNKLGGCGMRVPVPDGSLTDLTMVVNDPPSVDQINEAFFNAASSSMRNIIEYTDEPIVSVDVLGNPHSCLFDSQLTSVIGNMVKIVAWYDNEAGYSNRLRDLILKVAKEI